MTENSALRDALIEAWIVMNYTGDLLNERDMIEDRDEAICNPSWERIRALAPWLEKIDLDAEYNKRWQEVIGQCRECGADVQWNDWHQVTSGGVICIPCSTNGPNPSAKLKSPKGDTTTAET